LTLHKKKGNIQKFTEGPSALGLPAGRRRVRGVPTLEQWERTRLPREKDAPEMDAAKKAGKVIVKDAIADIALPAGADPSDESM